MSNLTKRQREMLEACASEHGTRVHTRYEDAVMERLYSKGLALAACNGTDKWFATAAGRAAINSDSPPPGSE